MENRTYNKFYPLQLWLATLIVTPFLNILLSALVNSFGWVNLGDMFFYIDFSWLFFCGLVFSLPLLIVVVSLYFILAIQQLNALVIKIAVIGVTVLGIFLTFYAFDNTIVWNISSFYSLAAIISGLLLKVEKKIQ